MKKEPLAFYLLRLALSLLMVGLIALLYWSNLLIEDQQRSLQTDVSELRSKIDELQETLSKQPRVSLANTSSDIVANESVSPYPNLLEEDPFYEKTLPGILGPHFKPWGTLNTSTVAKPDNLHPFSNFVEIGTWTGMCLASVAKQKFGFYENFCPDMALRVERRLIPGTDLPEFWVFLRKEAVWQPLNKEHFPAGFELAPHFLKKHPVTAHDYKFFTDAVMNMYNQTPNAAPLRTLYGDLESLRVVDDHTFVVRWKSQEIEENGKKVPKVKYMAQMLVMGLRPLPSFLYQYFADGTKIVEEEQDPNIFINSSVWAQNFAKHWSKNVIPSCGAWIFNGLSDTQISFVRNKDFYLPLEVLVEEMETQFRDSPDAIWQDFKAAKLDYYNLQPDKKLELEQFLKSDLYAKQTANGKAIKRIDYLARSFFFIGWNEVKPYFTSKEVRQALTMSIDRQRIIREYLHDMGEEITGTFYKYSPSNDPSIEPFPYDVRRARALLEKEGWYDSDGDGIIDKEIDGKRVPFKFQMTYYVKNAIGKSISEYIATALKEVGIVCELNGLDIADLSSTFDDKTFDALMMGWSLGTPPEDPRQLWYSSGAKEKGSSNAIGFSNKEVDKIINTLDYEYNVAKRNELYHQFDKILYDEQPYTFLYSPKSTLLYREYIQNLFIPAERPDLVPGANITTPDLGVIYLKKF